MDGTIAAWKQGHPMLWKHGPKSKAKPGQLGGISPCVVQLIKNGRESALSFGQDRTKCNSDHLESPPSECQENEDAFSDRQIVAIRLNEWTCWNCRWYYSCFLEE